MIKRISLLLGVLLSFNVWGQASVAGYSSNFSSAEKVGGYKTGFKVEIKDQRVYQDFKINLESLETSLNGFIELLYGSTSDGGIELTQLKPKEILINLEFYNFTEGSSNEAILKAIAQVHVNGGGYSTLYSDFSVNGEEFTSIKLKNIGKAKNAEEVEAVIAEFSKRFAKKILDRIQEETAVEEHLIYEITSIGTAIKSGTEAEAREKAITMALVRASEMAFGTQVTNYSEIVDYGDVTDSVLSETGSTVLYHEVLEDSVRFTDDGYCCLIVKSILKKK